MYVLVTGGTGFVGRAVVRHLIEAGHQIRLIVRRPGSVSTRELAQLQGIDVFVGNLLDPDSTAQACRGITAVIHLVGIISETRHQTFEKLHVQATQSVLSAAQEQGIQRFVHMSALGARPLATSRYHQTKWSAELALRGSQLDWTIFRPSIIYGPEDAFVNFFARMARWSPFLPVIGSGNSRLQPISVQAVARCFVGALDRRESISQTYDLCGPTALTMNDVLRTILEVTGRRRFLLHLPVSWAKVQAWVMEGLWGRILNVPPPLNRDQITMLREDNVGDPNPASRNFNLRTPPFREGIAAYLTP